MRCLAWIGAIAAALALAAAVPAAAQTPGLYDRPVLVLDAGAHTASIRRAAVDAAGRTIATASHDRTVRLWSAADGALLRTIRLPIGPGNIGRAYAVALSPDGATVAVGGWMRATGAPEQIYLLDAATGALTGRIDGLPNVVNHLVFSPDGSRLAAALWGDNGVRVYARGGGWSEAFRDAGYGEGSFGAAFAADGRLATTSWDGRLRLYGADGALLRAVDTGRERPIGVAFSPDGARLAVGFQDATAVQIYDGRSLAALPAPDVAGIANGSLSSVAWSADGATLYAGGRYDVDGDNPVVAWADGGVGPRRTLPAGRSTIMSLHGLPGGELLVAAQDPWLGVLEAGGAPRWTRAPRQMDPRGQQRTLAVSHDGASVRFGFEPGGARPARFDVAALRFLLDPAPDPALAPPEQDRLPIAGWADNEQPTLAGAPLPLKPFETSFSLAVHPDGARFVLGTHWYLRAFDADGAPLWRREAPGAWAVNISGDGRYVVAAYGDGTIRWHRMEDGAELLAFFPFDDGRNWVAWEPDGRFAATPGAMGALRWQVNRGWDAAPTTLPANAVPHSHRPEVIARVLRDGGTMQALYAADETERRAAIQRLTGATFAPGAQLHVLAIGVSDYAIDDLDLAYAEADAIDLHAALATQSDDLWPYQRGHVTMLANEDATGLQILNQLEEIKRRVADAPNQSDLVVVHFSGHGTVEGDGPDRDFYLLPHDAITLPPSLLRRTGFSARELRRAVADIAEHARVLLLIDACRAGAVGETDADLLRRTLAGRNVTVLTSSAGTQPSWEEPGWANGAFTEVVLEALDRAADTDRNGMISVEELTGYVARRVPGLTGGRQTPTVETRFSGELFASGM